MFEKRLFLADKFIQMSCMEVLFQEMSDECITDECMKDMLHQDPVMVEKTSTSVSHLSWTRLWLKYDE